MAKKNRKGKKKQQQQTAKAVEETAPAEKIKSGDEEKFTWEDIAAMSDSEDEDDDINNAIEMNTKAKNLRLAITNNLDGLMTSLQKERTNDSDDDEEEFEEDVLDASSVEKEAADKSDDDGDDNYDVEQINSKEMENNDTGNNKETNKSFIDQIRDKCDDNDNDSEDDDNDNDEGESNENTENSKRLQNSNNINSKALSVVTAELTSAHSKLSWAETFVIVPRTPLPFGNHGDPESNPLDIHDDLKREVAFYNTALEAVNLARPKCQEFGIPFSRQEDFFAEMVKTDDHMAKVKDRLIFENKKIEAVAQRKSNKEQKLRAKESQTNRLAEKAKRKKDHFQEVEEWANSAAKNRGGGLREEMDDHFLNNRNNRSGPNKKREAADRKFGFGDKKGRFKQNDRKSMNDMSGFNPRGNFAEGMKRTSKNGAGAERAGKRARDAKRARR